MNLETYYKIRNTIPTGSVICFRGRDWVSRIIEYFTKSKYSHVGILAWIPSVIAPNEPDRLMVFESTTLDREPDINGKFKLGVNLIPLSQRLYNYKDEAWIYPLKHELSEEAKNAGLTWLMKTEGENLDYNMAGAIAVGYYHMKNKFLQWIFWPLIRVLSSDKRLNRVFCSQLATEFEQIVGEVPITVVAQDMLPDDVSNFSCFGEPIQL